VTDVAQTPTKPAAERGATPEGDPAGASPPSGARAVGALPNLVVLGAQKCGTSGLHFYLNLHPEIAMSKPKELNFFIAERAWSRGTDWYMEHFDPDAPIRGESSPNYTTYPHHLGVPERMHEVLPEAKLIYLVRDPVERIAAHWIHNYAKRREKGDLRDTLLHPNTTYVLRSQYHLQLTQFLNHYPESQLLVLEQDDLRNRRSQTLREVFSYLGVDPTFQHPRFTRERHRSSRKRRATWLGKRVQPLRRTEFGSRVPKVFWNLLDAGLPLGKPIPRPDVREALGPEVVEVLHEDADRLRELTGRRFEHWSV
jgi:Sulfotransferase domain